MKFVVSSISPNMIDNGRFLLNFTEVSSTTFQHELDDAISHVGHEDIADTINVAYNKTPVHVRYGDTLLYANLERGQLKYYIVEVLQSLNDVLKREYGEI